MCGAATFKKKYFGVRDLGCNLALNELGSLNLTFLIFKMGTIVLSLGFYLLTYFWIVMLVNR